MATNNHNSVGEVTVEADEENTVDRKIKNQILGLRETVDQDERRLYVDRMQEEPHYSRQHANRDWAISVRQYLRGIKRLWADTDDVPIKNVDYYWQEILLHDSAETMWPPNHNDFKFELMQFAGEYDERKLRDAIGLGKRGDFPEPYRVEFRGLQSVLARDRIEHTWVITTHKEGPPPNHNIERPSISMPVPKHILENAVEAADNFLQQAGLGFNISIPDYTGGEEPGI